MQQRVSIPPVFLAWANIWLIGGYQYVLTLNGGTYKDHAQSASITLECDESQSRNVSQGICKSGKYEIDTKL